jgi:acetyl esterase/lipase
MFYRSGLARATEFYMPDTGRGPRNPLISPPYADLRGLPPLLIHVGADETLRDDSTELAQLFHPFLPKGRRSLDAASTFLRKGGRAVNRSEAACQPC